MIFLIEIQNIPVIVFQYLKKTEKVRPKIDNLQTHFVYGFFCFSKYRGFSGLTSQTFRKNPMELKKNGKRWIARLKAYGRQILK